MIAITATADTSLDAPEPGILLVQRRGGPAGYLELPPSTVTALVALTDGPVPIADLPDDPVSRGAVLRLAHDGLLHFSVVVNRREALRATLTGELSRFEAPESVSGAAIRLSKFAVIRRHDDELVVDAPVAGVRISVRDPRALTVVGELARPRTVAQLCTALLDCSLTLVEDTVRLLVGVGAAAFVDADGQLAEDRHPVLRQRELADVLLHAASRVGLGDQPIGATYPFLGVLPPAPAVADAADARRTDLPRPDLAALRASDPPLAAVMEGRSSTQVFGPESLTVAQVGEFLFRVARVRTVRQPEHPLPYELTNRPYPSAGATYDLELYLTVQHCVGLEPGIWHYDPAGHSLRLVNGDKHAVVRMIADAQRTAGGEPTSQVLVTLASRWDRLTWKYQGVAYALALKHVGVLYATMQLAATAMGLGGCPLETGDAALFAEVTRRDPAAESSVGEFLLGTAPPG